MKAVPIASGRVVSPHVVDLGPASKAGAARRKGWDIEQRLAQLADRLRRMFFLPKRDDARRLAPRSAAPAQATRTFEPRPAAPKPRAVPAMRRRPEPPPPPPKPPRAAPSFRLPRFAFAIAAPERWHRHLGAFILLALAITLPLHAFTAYTGLLKSSDAIAAQTREALSSLRSADFDRAAASFAGTRERLHGVTLTLAAFVTGQNETLRSGSRLLKAGEALSKAGAEVSSGFDALDAPSDKPLTDRVRALSGVLAAAMPDLDEAVTEFDGVSASAVPAAYRPAFENARVDLTTIRDDLKRFVGSSDAILHLLGSEGKRRYLVLFQNDHELRPTGGFIGSYALMDVDGGEIVNMEIPKGGSYDLRGGLNERIAAPDQLRLVNPRWEFQDANWFADFPTSAKTLAWFYEKSGGPTVDGVVAVTSSFMEDLLRVLGPIDMPEYGKTITADNFFDETQKAVEVDYDHQANTPKAFISDMAPKLLQKLMSGGKKDLVPMMNAVSAALEGKGVQFYFTDQDEQKLAADFGWTGQLRPLPDADFLSVVDANIAGGKTDGVIDEDIRHESDVHADGSIVDTVTIRRTHRGKDGDPFTGIKNIDYMRVYAPQGSELLSAEGFEAPGPGYFLSDDTVKPSAMLAAVEGRVETDPKSGTRVSQESGLAVFGNWLQIEPGESRTVRLTYRLPFRLDDLVSHPQTAVEKVMDAVGAYAPTAQLKLAVDKQAGAAHRTFADTIRLPSGWNLRERVPETLPAGLDRDLYVGMIITKDE